MMHGTTNIKGNFASRRMRWAGNVVRLRERRGLFRDFLGKPEGKRPFGRPRRRSEVNIKKILWK